MLTVTACVVEHPAGKITSACLRDNWQPCLEGKAGFDKASADMIAVL
jgi:hypothetical protein